MLRLLMQSIEFLVSSAYAIGSVFLLFVVFLVSADVAMRYIVHGSIPGSMAIVSMTIACALFLGLSKSQEQKQHISIDFFLAKFMGRIYTLEFTFFALIFWKSIGVFKVSLEMGEYIGGAAIRVPVYPARGVLVLGTFLMMVQIIKDMIELMRQSRKD